MIAIRALQARLVALGFLPSRSPVDAWDAPSGWALWAACEARAIDAREPAVLAARAEVARAYGCGDDVALGPDAVVINSKRRIIDSPLPLWVFPYRMGTLQHATRQHPVVAAILHHDVCGSARDCYQALASLGFSTHFAVDDPGVVLQFLDPSEDIAYHAKGHVPNASGGYDSVGWNGRTIGIDLSNPVLQDTKAGGEDDWRDVVTEDTQGRPVTGLDFGPQQESATVALLRFLTPYYPGLRMGTRLEHRYQADLRPDTPGVYGHYHVNRGKIDPFGFDFQRLQIFGRGA